MDQLIQAIAAYWSALGAFFAFDAALLSEPGMVARILLLVLLLACSAFFSGSETALFSLSRLDLQQLRRARNPHSETLHALLDQPRRLIISILTGNELINIAATVNAAGILLTLYGDERAGWINIIVMVPLLLLFGEVTPKTVAVSNPVRVSTQISATPMSFWIRLVAPLRELIRMASDRVTTLIVGEEKAAENILQVDEFLTLVEQVAEEGELDATERALIYNLLEANETEIVEIMTPRTRTVFLDSEMGVPEIVEKVIAYRHTRIPVCRVHRDNLVGFIHAEEVMNRVLDEEDLEQLSLDDIMFPPVVVPLTKKVDEMFDFFRANRVRAAICLNEFGGVEGFITIHDVLTFIFGDISGESKGRDLYEERDNNIYEVPGDMKLTDFNNLTHFGLEDPRMTTIGGVAFRYLDRLPQVGDRVTVEDISLTVLEMDSHRISKVRAGKVSAEEDLEDEVEEIAPERVAETSAEEVETKATEKTSFDSGDDVSADEPDSGKQGSVVAENLVVTPDPNDDGKDGEDQLDTDVSESVSELDRDHPTSPTGDDSDKKRLN